MNLFERKEVEKEESNSMSILESVPRKDIMKERIRKFFFSVNHSLEPSNWSCQTFADPSIEDSFYIEFELNRRTCTCTLFTLKLSLSLFSIKEIRSPLFTNFFKRVIEWWTWPVTRTFKSSIYSVLLMLYHPILIPSSFCLLNSLIQTMLEMSLVSILTSEWSFDHFL